MTWWWSALLGIAAVGFFYAASNDERAQIARLILGVLGLALMLGAIFTTPEDLSQLTECVWYGMRAESC